MSHNHEKVDLNRTCLHEARKWKLNTAGESWGKRALRSRVYNLTQYFYHRCRSCVLKHSVTQQNATFPTFLEEHLPKKDFEAILYNPMYYIQDQDLSKSFVDEDRTTWDYLLAHDPKEITPIHLYYKKKQDEKNLLRREALANAPHGGKLSTSIEPRLKPHRKEPREVRAVRKKTASMVEREKQLLEKEAFIDKLRLPKIESVPLLWNSNHHRITKKHSPKIWHKFTLTCLEAEAKLRASIKDNYKKPGMRWRGKSPGDTSMDATFDASQGRVEKKVERMKSKRSLLLSRNQQRRERVERGKEDIARQRALKLQELENRITEKSRDFDLLPVSKMSKFLE